MSGTLTDLKKSLEFNGHLTDILGVLKEIAMGAYWSMEKSKNRFEYFNDSFDSFFKLLDFADFDHPYFRTSAGRPAIVLVTSDEGFSGGLNNRLVQEALLQDVQRDAEFIAVGSQGISYLRDSGRDFVPFPGIDSEALYARTRDLKNFLAAGIREGRYSRVSVVYAKSVSFVVQRITTTTLLPCRDLLVEKEGREPVRGGVILESDPLKIIEYLVESWVEENLFQMFEDAKLSEYSSRTVHLEESHNSLAEEHKQLKFQYFRSRRAVLDRSMRETFSGMLAKRQGGIDG